MPPVYAVISFFSYRYFRSYTYYSLIESSACFSFSFFPPSVPPLYTFAPTGVQSTLIPRLDHLTSRPFQFRSMPVPILTFHSYHPRSASSPPIPSRLVCLSMCPWLVLTISVLFLALAVHSVRGKTTVSVPFRYSSHGSVFAKTIHVCGLWSNRPSRSVHSCTLRLTYSRFPICPRRS